MKLPTIPQLNLSLPQNNLLCDFDKYKRKFELNNAKARMDNLAEVVQLAFYGKKDLKTFLLKVLDKGENLKSLGYRYQHERCGDDLDTRWNVLCFLQNTTIVPNMTECDYQLYQKVVVAAIKEGIHPLEFWQGHKATPFAIYLTNNDFKNLEYDLKVLDFLVSLHPDTLSYLNEKGETAIEVFASSCYWEDIEYTENIKNHIQEKTVALLRHMSPELREKNWIALNSLYKKEKTLYEQVYSLMCPVFEKYMLEKNILSLTRITSKARKI